MKKKWDSMSDTEKAAAKEKMKSMWQNKSAKWGMKKDGDAAKKVKEWGNWAMSKNKKNESEGNEEKEAPRKSLRNRFGGK